MIEAHRSRCGIVFSWVLLLASCTPLRVGMPSDAQFDGADASSSLDAIDSTDVPRDSAIDAVIPDAPDIGATDVVAPPDAGFTVCGIPGFACDPFGDLGCPADRTCGFDSFVPLTAACRAVGAGAFAQPCVDHPDCARGLACVDHHCSVPCCSVGGDARCSSLVGSTASHCGVRTGNNAVTACTEVGECDYVAQTGCSPGQFCNPENLRGIGACMTVGTSPLYGPCHAVSDCVEGATCSMGSTSGECRRYCNPRTAGSFCGMGSMCRAFSDRPLDWGYCDP